MFILLAHNDKYTHNCFDCTHIKTNNSNNNNLVELYIIKFQRRYKCTVKLPDQSKQPSNK